MISQSLSRQLRIKQHNTHKMRKVLEVVRTNIYTKGGCFIENVGVSYYNPKNGTRDPIGWLLTPRDVKQHFGLIKDDAQKPLVRKIEKRFGINVSREQERQRFVKFLQALQDAHDEVFDEFNNDEPKENRISLFGGKCNQIANEYGITNE